MVNYKHKDLFMQSHIDKQLKVFTDDKSFTATNTDINWENFELTESLCSETELQFGNCEASSVKFQIRNAFIPLIGKWLTITETLEGNTDVPFQYGKYKVFSDVPTADKEYRDIIAYDAMYDIINADVADWYNSTLPNKDSKMTMKKFREEFIRYFGLSEIAPESGLANDNMIVEKTIEPSELSGKDVITAICEINGCFGHIGRDGKFHYIYLLQDIQGLYPADFLFPDHVPAQWDYLPQAKTEHLYPQDPKASGLAGGTYISCKYEDYMVRQINKLQIRMEENDIGAIYGEGNNCYIIEDNFLIYGKSAEQLNKIAKNTYDKIRGIVYRPFSCESVGNPCLEVGDPIKFNTKYEIIESYIFTRTLKGIQSLRDSYTASGNERRAEKVNGIQKSIVQLKGKSNVLERNIEETRSEIKDTEQNLQSEIRQTASEIRTEVKEADKGLSSRITQNANSITTKVTKGQVSSEISQEAGQVSIKANRLVVESNQFKLDGNGNATFGGILTAAKGSFSGDVSASSGTFNNVTINSSCTVAGQSITGTIANNVGWNGLAIQNDYIGNLSAGKLTIGTVGRPYIYNGVSITDAGNNFGNGNGNNTFRALHIYAQKPIQAGGSSIGSNDVPFAAVYSSVFKGSLSSSSSKETKDNIKAFDTEKCIGIIKNTEVVSYNYKNDIKDNSESIKEFEEEIKRCQLLKDKEEDEALREIYSEKIAEIKQNIKILKNERETFPETRYGFISEDAPWELVSMDRKTVDTYSAVAMCFGAIQEMSKEIERLKAIMEKGGIRTDE